MCPPQWGTFADVHREFRRYGDIDKLEIFPEKYPFYADDDECYAYVTYADSMGAFAAIRDAKNAREGLRIALADTWRQPDAPIAAAYAATNDELTLNRLNEYCLLEIFAHLDVQSLLHLSRVCDRFDDLIARRVYPQHKRIQFDLTSYRNSSLSSIRDILLNVGQHVHQVKLEMDNYGNPPNAARLLDIFTLHLGENVQRLDLTGVHITDRFHKQLRPILLRLKVLKWSSEHYEEHGFEVDFVHWCPRLEKLALRSFMRFDINAEKWQSLRSATIDMHSFYDSESYPQFFRNNPQLKRLKINVFHHFSMINDICFRLQQLQVLKIHCCEGAEARNFRELTNLKQLRTLRLSMISLADNNALEFFNLLGELTTLEKLELSIDYRALDNGFRGIFEPEHCHLPAMGKRLRNLQAFHIGRYGLTGDSILAFVQVTPTLRQLKLSESNLTLDRNLLEKIADTRRQQATHTQTRTKCVSPLAIYVDEDPLLLDDIDGVITVHIFRAPNDNFD